MAVAEKEQPNGTTHGLYIPRDRKEEYMRAVRKLQRRRPGQSASTILIDCLVAEANRYADIPGLDDPPVAAPAASAAV